MAQHNAAIFDAHNAASPLSIPTAKTALLLMDYHSMLINVGGEAADAAVLKAKSMRDWAIVKGFLVVHCLVDLYLPMLPTFKNTACFKHTLAMMDISPNGYDEYPDVAYNGSFEETVVTRAAGYISVLKSHGLMEMLSAREVKSLVLCGVSTSGCVLSTARAAGDEEFIVTVIEDACMDLVPGLHDTLVQKVLPSQAHLTTAAEFQMQWDNVQTIYISEP